MLVAVSTSRRSIAAAAFLHSLGMDDRTPLDVRGVPSLRHRDYGYVFSRVGRAAPRAEEARIWFGELRSAQDVRFENDRISVEFAVGCVCEPGAPPVGRVKVEADTGGWTEFQRTVFRDRLIDAVKRARGELGGGRPVTRMYVLGRRDPRTPCGIRIDHPRRFALVSGTTSGGPPSDRRPDAQPGEHQTGEVKRLDRVRHDDLPTAGQIQGIGYPEGQRRFMPIGPQV